MYLLWLVVVWSVELKLSGDRIFGGIEVSPKFKYDFVTSLAYLGNHSCGGALINARTVITAAHCVFGHGKDWIARFHRHNITEDSSREGGRESKVYKRTVHPSYDRSGNHEYDIAVFRVNTQAASFVVFDTGAYTRAGMQLHVIGWGVTESLSGASPVLKEVQVPVFLQDVCKVAYPELDASHFCAGYGEGGRDSCKGDSGGPILYKSRLGYTLVGIVSYGEGCAKKGYPGVYTSIAATKHFILTNL